MAVKIFTADAFADTLFGGNPAAVCLLDGQADEGWMRALAAEMNLSETAYIQPEEGEYRLRWFSPTVEVDLCGHATLAGAHILWETGRHPDAEPIVFRTRSGRLTATRRDGMIWLDFPAEPAEPGEPPAGLAEHLGAIPLGVSRNRMDLLVILESEEAVRGLIPDLRGLARLPVRGVMVTAEGSDGYDFVSRFFAPAAGVDEDPVTGSAHCALGPYWAARLGRRELIGYQASARGGAVRVEVDGDRVRLGGNCVTVLRGEVVA